MQPKPHPLFSYFLESVELGSMNSLISIRIRVLQGPLCDFKVWSLEGKGNKCHLLAMGTLSPFVLNLASWKRLVVTASSCQMLVNLTF